MKYFIRAKPRMTEIVHFWDLLNDGTLPNQKPDGSEIVASMMRAVISNGRVEWQETCYCSPPLAHERSTVYDRFFESMEINPVTSAQELRGERFWDFLLDHSRTRSDQGGQAAVEAHRRYVPLRIL